jgi:hypothetical protein
MKVRTKVKAGRLATNHNQALVREGLKGVKVRTSVKAGRLATNHNQTLVRDVA